MKINKQFKNWWIDALLMVGYLFCFYLDLTGVAGHQWLGAGLTLLAVIHLWLHLDWVKAVTKRLFGKGCARNRWYYLLDVLIVVGFIVILETGLIISTWFDLAVVNYIAWLDLHTYASYATLGLILVKIGMHWRWVVSITGKIFGANGKTAPVNRPTNGLTPAPVPVHVKVQPGREVVDRRQFLALLGVVSLGSLLAITNVISENAVKPVKAFGALTEADGTADVALSPAAEASAEPTELGAVNQAFATSAPTEAVTAVAPVTTETVQPATPEPTQAVAMCSVQCPKGCVFPGRCRRYIDQNGNGLCDLGECL